MLTSTRTGSGRTRTMVLTAREMTVGAICVVLAGLDGCSRKWNTIRVYDRQSGNSHVVIYSPPYGKGARAPDEVTLFWEGRRVFSGRLPQRVNESDGMPIELLEIQTSAGEHKLEAKTGSQLQRLVVRIEEDRTVYVRIFGANRDGQEQLLLDLGENPGLN